MSKIKNTQVSNILQLQIMEGNKKILIAGDNGVGKTYQIKQYINNISKYDKIYIIELNLHGYDENNMVDMYYQFYSILDNMIKIDSNINEISKIYVYIKNTHFYEQFHDLLNDLLNNTKINIYDGDKKTIIHTFNTDDFIFLYEGNYNYHSINVHNNYFNMIDSIIEIENPTFSELYIFTEKMLIEKYIDKYKKYNKHILINANTVKLIVQASEKLNSIDINLNYTRIINFLTDLFDMKINNSNDTIEINDEDIKEIFLLNKKDIESMNNMQNIFNDSIGKNKESLNDTNVLDFSKFEESFDDIIGLNHAKKKLQELSELYSYSDEELKKYNINRNKGFILYGSPGTGKTMICKAFANTLKKVTNKKVKFLYKSANSLIDNKNNVLESMFAQIRKYLLKEKNSIIVLFLDEIDAFRARGSSSHNNSYYDNFTNELIFNIDNAPTNLIIIGATNRISLIDETIKRNGRLDIVIEIENKFKQEEVFKYLVKEFITLNIDDDILKSISKIMYYEKGSKIAKIVNSIKIHLLKNKNITQEEAKLITFSEKYNLYEEQEKDDVKYYEIETAYHEAGHAVALLTFYDEESIHEISIYPKGETAGFVSFDIKNKKDDYDYFYKQMIILLSGRYAEKLYTDTFSAGAVSDLQKLNELIRKMITEYGMSKLGNITYDINTLSENAMKLIEKEHKRILNSVVSLTEKFIYTNKEQIIKLAKRLKQDKIIIDRLNEYKGTELFIPSEIIV